MKTNSLESLLNWNPMTEELHDSSGRVCMKSVRRSDNGTLLGVVGSDRTVIDNKEIVEDCVQLANDLNIRMEEGRVWEIHGGARLEIHFPLPQTSVGGDSIDPYVRFTASHDSSIRRFCCLHLRRRECFNVFSARMAKGLADFAKFSKNHKVNWGERRSDFFANFVQLQKETYEKIAAMQAERVTVDRAQTVIKKLYSGESTRARNVRDQVFSLFQNGRGTSGRTAWDLFNGVTEYENYYKSFRETSHTSREENAMINALGIDFQELAKACLS